MVTEAKEQPESPGAAPAAKQSNRAFQPYRLSKEQKKRTDEGQQVSGRSAGDGWANGRKLPQTRQKSESGADQLIVSDCIQESHAYRR
jgi:hypothetical protein